MDDSPQVSSDPDRFFQFLTPGSQEWWYFDAISSDGRDILVIVWYAGLPFDPKYGVAALRHLKHPTKFPIPDPLDHSAIGFQWYRDGKPMAYALNAFPAGDFHHQAEPFTIDIAGNRLERDSDGYRLHISTSCVDQKTAITAEIRFRPVSSNPAFEQDFGSEGSSHIWILAAPDCGVEGEIIVGANAMSFEGRGYHDHNAGEIEISKGIRRWEWGRVHRGATTDVFYLAQPHAGPSQSLWISCQDGQPVDVRQGLNVEKNGSVCNVFGVASSSILAITNGVETLRRTLGRCVDDGPFYRRWETTFEVNAVKAQGISELLDTRNLNRRLFNWMVPYRLKRPRD